MGFNCVKLDVVQLPLEETTSFEGNATINCLKRLLEEMFKFAPYVRIIGEDKIYHHSEFNELENHINQLNTPKNE